MKFYLNVTILVRVITKKTMVGGLQEAGSFPKRELCAGYLHAAGEHCLRLYLRGRQQPVHGHVEL